jgi:hypothetical protein
MYSDITGVPFLFNQSVELKYIRTFGARMKPKLSLLSFGLAAFGLVSMPFNIPKLDYIFGSFGIWIAGIAVGIIGLAFAYDRKRSALAIFINMLCFPLGILYIILFEYSPH